MSLIFGKSVSARRLAEANFQAAKKNHDALASKISAAEQRLVELEDTKSKLINMIAGMKQDLVPKKAELDKAKAELAATPTRKLTLTADINRRTAPRQPIDLVSAQRRLRVALLQRKILGEWAWHAKTCDSDAFWSYRSAFWASWTKEINNALDDIYQCTRKCSRELVHQAVTQVDDPFDMLEVLEHDDCESTPPDGG